MRAHLRAITGAVLLCAVVVHPAAAATPTAAPVQGLTLVSDTVLSPDGRLHTLTLHSEALGRNTRVRVLLPVDYATATTKRYPVLLLVHGASGNERSWTEGSHVEEHTAGLDLISVMPDGGTTGFYSDWLDGPAWESHHIEELVPWIDATYRTIGTRAGRAIVGLSMGGYGSMEYAARHPDLFVAAASFSGAVDIADASIPEAAALNALGYGDDRRWGPIVTHEANWRGHNPPDLAPNLRWTDVALTTASGVPCPGDDPLASVTEVGVASMTTGFATRLSVVGVPHHLDLRPCGTHQWHYWDADLATWLPHLMAILAHPPATPAAFDYRTTEPSASVWGWTFAAHRPATEFLDLRAVSPAGLVATGSGTVDVVTAPAYEPGATYAVASDAAGVVTLPVAIVPPVLTLPDGAGPTGVTAVADDTGRLRFTLDLGPAHTLDQYSLEADAAEALAAGSYFHSATVTIARRAAPPVAVPPAPTQGATGRQTIPATGAPAPPWLLVATALSAAILLRCLANHP